MAVFERFLLTKISRNSELFSRKKLNFCIFYDHVIWIENRLKFWAIFREIFDWKRHWVAFCAWGDVISLGWNIFLHFQMQLNSEYQQFSFSHEYFYDKDEPLS